MKSDAGPGTGKIPSQAPRIGNVYHFGPFELDPDRYELRRRQFRIRLSPAPLDLLFLLVEQRNTLVLRETIAARLWPEPDMVDVDQGINSAIRRVRESLRDDPAKPRFIETVVGKGYRFIAAVEERAGEAPTLSPTPLPPTPLPPVPPPSVPPPPIFDSAGALTILPGNHESATSGKPPQTSLNGFSHSAPRLPSARWSQSAKAVFAFGILLLLAAITYVNWRQRTYQRPRHGIAFTQITTNDTELRVTAAALSPDGQWIAYADSNGLYLRLLPSGKTIPLHGPKDLRIERISWFRDRTRMLVSGFGSRPAASQIWTVSVTEGAPQLFRDDAANGIASPDGTRIAFTSNRNTELWISGNAGEAAHLLLADRSGKSFACTFWAAGGKRLSYLRRLNGVGPDDYESADADSATILASQRGITFDSAASLGSGPIFFLRDAPARNRSDFSLWTVKTNAATGAFVGAPVQVATIAQGRAYGLTASEDGTRLSLLLETGNPHVFLGALHQPGPTLADVQRLTFDTKTDYPGSWLHDNKTILFESDRLGPYRLYGQRLHEPDPQEFNTGQGSAVLPQVTPDGKWILYASDTGDPGAVGRRLFRMAAAGGRPEPVPNEGPSDEFRCPLLRGSTCVLRRVEGHRFLVYYALDPMTGQGKELGRTAWLPHVLSDWCVAPDGSAVALTSHDNSNPRIRIVPLGGDSKAHEQEVTVNGFGMLSGISWSADRRGWYVAADTKTETSLLYVSLAGEAHVLRETPMSTWGVPSPDGKKLAFVDRAVDCNVWLWQMDTPP